MRPIKDLQDAAKIGDADAQFELGNAYWIGKEVRKDDSEARRQWRSAGEQGHADAQFNLGLGSAQQGQFDEAIVWYKQAASQGHALAAFNLGTLYREGKGVAPNMEQALSHIKSSAMAGLATAQATIGTLYLTGDAGETNYDKAAMWFKKGVAQNDTACQYKLGYLYSQGKGVDKDLARAYCLMFAAAEDGYSHAINDLNLIRRRLSRKDKKRVNEILDDMGYANTEPHFTSAPTGSVAKHIILWLIALALLIGGLVVAVVIGALATTVVLGVLGTAAIVLVLWYGVGHALIAMRKDRDDNPF